MTSIVKASRGREEVMNFGKDWREYVCSVRDKLKYTLTNENTQQDVVIVVGCGSTEKKIKAHSFMLFIGSEVLERLLEQAKMNNQGIKEIKLPDVRPEAMKFVLKYIYTDCTELENENGIDILYASLKLNLHGLAVLCVIKLKDEISEENVLRIFEESVKMNVEELVQKSQEFILKNAGKVFQNQQFRSITNESLCQLLALDELELDEISIFNSVIGWGKAECERSELEESSDDLRFVLKKVVPLIRFTLISMHAFASVVVPTKILDDKEVSDVLVYLAMKTSNAGKQAEPPLWISSISERSKQKESTSPILAIQFGLHTIKTGVIINGMFNLVANRLAESQFPNMVAITRQGEVLIGNEVRYRHTDVSYSFNCGALMRLPSNEIQSEKIRFQGQDILVTKEFLCGLILSRIKKESEEFLKQRISRVVITVPLWYTSSQRQATKHAGIIAGFESIYLMNDITAAALAYSKQPCNHKGCHDILIINAIAGNVDVAVYEIGNGKTKMKTCAGFLHGQSNSEAPWMFKPLVQIWRMHWQGNTTASGNETEAVTKLVEHCVKNYQIAASTVLFDGDIESNSKYLEELKYIATRKQRDYIEIEGAILMGAAIFAELLNIDYEYADRCSISDLLPYQIEFVRQNSSRGKIFERHTPLISNYELKQDFTFQSNGDVCIEILEIGNADNITTGFLHIRGNQSGTVYPEVTAFISSEGILRFTARHRYGQGKTIDLIWKSYNLSEEEIAKYASLITSYYPNPEQVKILQGCQTDLLKLASDLLSYSHQGVTGFGKEQISVAVQEAYQEANAAHTTLERIEKITSDLAKLKSKYCSHM